MYDFTVKAIDSLKLIKFYVDLTIKDLLIIFDIDDVLIMPEPGDYLKCPYRNDLWSKIKHRSSRERIRFLKFKIMKTTKYRLVDPDATELLEYLSLNFIPAIALTSLSTGKVDEQNHIEELRIKILHELGIDFTKTTPITDTLLATELSGKNLKFIEGIGSPMITKGIIFTAGVDKGIVLNYMLNKYNYYPKNILFVDDDLTNLHSIENLCKKLGVNFYGFHYTAVSKMPFPKINKQFEKLRFRILETENTWLNDTNLVQ